MIGQSRIMLADEAPDWGHLSPDTVGGCPVKFHLNVENADEMVQRAVDAGAILLRPVARSILWRAYGHGHRPVRLQLVRRDH